jgi:fatty acid desaturase
MEAGPIDRARGRLMANIDGGHHLHLMSGNLSHQIEHHLFPDMPSNRYAEIAPRIRALCERFGLPHTSGSLARQTGSLYKRILRLAFPGPRPARMALVPEAPDQGTLESVRVHSGEARMGPEASPVSAPS